MSAPGMTRERDTGSPVQLKSYVLHCVFYGENVTFYYIPHMGVKMEYILLTSVP